MYFTYSSLYLNKTKKLRILECKECLKSHQIDQYFFNGCGTLINLIQNILNI